MINSLKSHKQVKCNLKLHYLEVTAYLYVNHQLTDIVKLFIKLRMAKKES